MIKLFVIIFFSAAFVCEAKEKICLNMIVKNESRVIRRCLDSVIPLIDYWVIVDTGSTDGTQDIIKMHLKEIPGELHERPWKNFGENRNEALQLAKDKGDFILFIDGDDWLELDDDFQLPPLTLDLYSMWRGPKGFSYLVPQLVRANLPWKWVGVVHEYLSCDLAHQSTILNKARYLSGNDGGSYNDKEKYQKYVKLLEDGLKEEPNNSRYVFYLATSYAGTGDLIKAVECYEKRISMGGWDQEVFWSLLQIAQSQRILQMDPDIYITSFYRAHRFRPHRPEPLYYLAGIYIQQGNYKMAYECLVGWNFIPKPQEKDSLFNMDWIEEYGLLFQLSIASYYIGNYKESLDCSNALLELENLPEEWRKLALSNRTFPLKKLNEDQSESLYNEAISHEKARDLSKALKCYEEVVQIGKNQDRIFDALLKMASIQERLKMDPKIIAETYLHAHQIKPNQVEPLYHLAAHYRSSSLYQDAYQTALKGLSIITTQNPEPNWIFDCGMLWEFSLNAWSVGKFDEAIDASSKLMNCPKVSEENRGHLKKNMSYYRAGNQVMQFARQKWGTPPWERENK